MKSFLLTGICTTLLFTGISGCKEKNPLDPTGGLACGKNAEKVTEAATRLSQNPTTANCEAYKKEVIDFIKSCPTFYTGVQKQQLEEFANTPCD